MLLSTSCKTTNNVTELNKYMLRQDERFSDYTTPVVSEVRSCVLWAIEDERSAQTNRTPAAQPGPSATAVSRSTTLTIDCFLFGARRVAVAIGILSWPTSERPRRVARSLARHLLSRRRRATLHWDRLGAAEERTSVTTADRPRLMLQRHPDGSCWCYATDA